AAQEMARRLRVESAHVKRPVPMSLQSRQVGQWESGRHQCRYATDAFREPRQQSFEQGRLDLPERAGFLLTLHALQAIEHEQMGAAHRKRFVQQVKEATLARARRQRGAAREITIRFLKE